MNYVNSSIFDFDSNFKMMFSDVKTLEYCTNAPDFSQLWVQYENGSKGIRVRSDVTKRIAEFELEQTDYCEREYGIVQGWRLRPSVETVKQIPRLANVYMLIVNA